MKISFKMHLKRIVILYILLLFTSCSSRSEIKIPENIIQETPPAKAIEFITNERIVNNGVYLNGENIGGMKESEVLAKIRNYAIGIDKVASDATIDNTTWQIVRGNAGKKVNVEKTFAAVLNAQEGNKVGLIVEEVLPSVTSQKLLDNIVVIGKYTTPLLNKDASRLNNIELASQKLDGLKLSPDQEFSFNKVVGRRTKAKGYEDAPIIIDTKNGPKEDNDIGGGICQVSTTLFNAIEECNLKILERHVHSKDVGYVPKGEDATINYGSADLRFRNTRNYPIMIRTFLESNSFTVKIIENRNL